MSLDTLQEIEQAISRLSPRELEELYLWLDSNCTQPFDARIADDLALGRLDTAIDQALDDEKHSRVETL
jgi:hypothetical protein